MKLIMESWRKYLKEEKVIKESYMGVQDHYDTLDEDSLYDLDIEDLEDLRDHIEDFGGPGPQSDPKDLYPTIMARIEALEDEMVHTTSPYGPDIENLYDGEFILKLLKAFFTSANQGIELASMIPGTESLLKEFELAHEIVAELIKYAEDQDDSPWMDTSANDSSRSMAGTVHESMRFLMHQVIKPEEPEGGIGDEQQETIDAYHRWTDSMVGLREYASAYTTATRQEWENDYKFIKDWVGAHAERRGAHGFG